MRDIPDQRVHLEVSLIKLTHPQADDSTSALLERVERLERALAEGGGVGGGPAVQATPARTLEAPPAPPGGPAPTRAGASAAKHAKDTRRAPSPAEVGTKLRSPCRSRPAPGSAGPPAPGAESGPDLARRTLGAVRRQGGSGRGAPRVDTPGNALPAHRAVSRCPALRRAPTRVDCGRPGDTSRCHRHPALARRAGPGLGRRAARPAAQPGQGPVQGGKVPGRRGVDGDLRLAQRDAPFLLRRGSPRCRGRPGDALRDGGTDPTRGRR